ncbi:MAG TPA: amino acid adenylation domain-containing protein [Pyrinomonadaceae bacterium]
MTSQNIQDLFSQAAEKFSGREAVVRAGGAAVTYGELERESNRLANYLLSLGASKGSPVAILSEDAVAVITAILGVLKAGCVFVPLDPHIPARRLRSMAGEVAPRWFLVAPGLAGLAAEVAGEGAALVRLGAAGGGVAQGGTEPSGGPAELSGGLAEFADTSRPGVESSPDDVCYVYFTSGSTGNPKGIAGRLKGIDHFIRWEIENLGVGPGTRVSQLLSFTFDGSLRDIFVPLCAGGTVCVPEGRETLLDARRLVEWLDEERVEVVHCVPSVFRALVNESPGAERFRALRYILMAGEPLLPADVRRWTETFGERVSLVNLYGTSETTMAKFVYFVRPEDVDRPSIPVGKPMPGARALVLDEKGRPCPTGVVGEIYIRTPYRSHGYYNRPELTAEVFVPNPFGTDPSDIVHRTGDLGRVLEDGNFEFLGRKDRQVKVRGVRVELGEVENVLRGHPAVKDVAVVDQEDPSRNKFLCAYVVAREPVEFGALRDYMAEYLPDFMLPSAFLLMDRLPRTISGKVDRRALPPIAQKAGRGADYLAPRTQVEEVLAGVWAQVLGVTRVGVRDNFFHLGGHSLMATQIASRMRNAFQVDLPLQSLFETPTVEGLAARVEQAMASGEGLTTPPVGRTERAGAAPLSFAQQRLWFLDQMDGGAAAYNIGSGLRMTGALNAVALEQSLGEVVRRHEALRTRFPAEAGEPAQVVDERAPLSWVYADLRAVPEGRRQDELQRLGRAEARRGFDLERAPLLRVTLVRLGEEEHVLLLTMHHIVSDGWSMGVLVSEVSALYEAFAGGSQSPLSELPVQYADYAAWQRGWLQGEVLERQLSYWREKLAGAPPLLELPTDRPRPPVQTFRGARRVLALDTEVAQACRALSRREGATLFMTLLAGFKALLYRWSGEGEVVVGTPVAGRSRPELEPLIGFFVNTLVLRTNVEGGASFRELVGRVRETTLEAFTHQDIPFEKLVEELAPGRSLSHTPLFQTVFVMQNTPMPELRLGGVGLGAVRVDGGTSKFDLTLLAEEAGEGLVLTLEYNTDLFDAGTAERLLRQYESLLREAATDPNVRVGRARLMSEEERALALQGWKPSGAGAGVAGASKAAGLRLHERFEAQAARRPGAVAVSGEGWQVSYGELNRRANRLARRLRRLGVRPETRVGVAVGRGEWMAVAVLGVLKAGGAYVPLDVAYPKDRLAFMIEDSGLSVLVTERELLGSLPELEVPALCLDAESEALGAEGAENLAAGVTAGGLAYVIYTSGSTGRPKGTLVTHANVERLFDTTRLWFDFGEQDVWTLFHSFAFDFSVWELWGALLYGGRLVVVPYWVSRSPEAFYRLLVRERVTVLNQTPSAFLQLAEAEGGAADASALALRLVIFGGEALEVSALRPWFARHGDARPRLVNMYGITETTVHVTYRPLTKSDARAAVGSVIGEPIPDLKVYPLDEHAEPTPLGVPGELYVGGAGLARGYLGRPALTAQKFVPDPFSPEPGARLYRSGDRARHLPGGDIEYLGRADQQIKIRGFRVEAGEIEAALREHARVGEAVVRAWGEGAEKRLAAYFTAAPGAEAPTAAELREHLRARLPEYMVPAGFVGLGRVPLTPNGKVDRRALPEPAWGEAAAAAAPASEGGVAAWRTPAEELVAGVWAEVLGVEAHGPGADFFELGGHSLLATRVVSRLRAATGVEVELRRLFESPTVEGLAGWVEAGLREGVEGGGGGRILPRAEAGSGAAPLSFAQQRLWFLDRLEPGGAAYNVPAGVRLTGALNAAALEQSLGEVVRRHEALRTSFPAAAGEPTQAIAVDAPLSWRYADLTGVSEELREAEVLRLGRAEPRKGFDLTRAPLLRVTLLRVAETEHVLLLTMHHIVSDGWSMGVLVSEVSALYEAFAAGGPSPLAELDLQYADYAAWQRGWLQGDSLERQLSYWREKLEGAPPLLELPTDRPRPPVQTFRGARRVLALDAEVARACRALSRREGATLFMTLLAGFKALLHRWSGESEVVVGTPVAGRSRPELEPLIGFFVNTLVLRTGVEGEGSFRELVGRVRETTLEAFARQDIPFEKLVEELAPGRSLSHTPLFQVMFVMQNTPMPELRLGGVGLGAVRVDGGTSKFDLTLLAEEAGEGLVLTLEYNTDLFDAGTAERLLRQYESLLREVTGEPGVAVGRARLMSDEERDLTLGGWGRGPLALPASAAGGGGGAAVRRVHEQFEETARLRPGAVAVSGAGWEVSYGELNRRANQLARGLRRLGVGPEVRVGVAVERGAELAVAVLGVLKAGGAYVPLDVAYPKDRLAFMIEDSRPAVLLTQEKFLFEMPEHESEVVCVDSEWDGFARESGEDLPTLPGADTLAYVIYTSGSTGKPKGVQVAHGGLANLAEAQIRAFGLGPQDRVLQFSSLSFDASIFEIVMALRVGATLCMATRESLLPGPELIRYLRTQEITCVTIPPSALAVLPEDALPALRTVIVAGEACPAELVERWGRGRRFFNAYGPTETTVWATVSECAPGGRKPHIGRPIDNAQVYLLDRWQEPVPVGVPGELHVGGAGLARCYMNRPGLTAERFTPDPFGGGPGARLYKTGDLARWLPSGDVDYLGRVDNQVKVRGFRVELGEIEATLMRHAGVREAVVVLREDEPGRKNIVAYVVPEPGHAPDSGALRAYLRETLADFMLPSTFVTLERIPVTPNGKVNRKALPRPEAFRPELSADFVAPRSDVEITIASVWREALGIDVLGAHDNFFDLGGHSLLLVQVHQKLNAALGRELSIVDLFKYPTISALADHLSSEADAPPPFDEGAGAEKLQVGKNRLQQQLRLSRRAAGEQSGGTHESL